MKTAKMYASNLQDVIDIAKFGTGMATTEPAEAEITAVMAKHMCNRATAIHALNARAASAMSQAELAKKRAVEAAHDAMAKRIHADIMTDLGCSI